MQFRVSKTRRNKYNSGFLAFFVFLTTILSFLYSAQDAQAQGTTQTCSRNGIGDVICPRGASGGPGNYTNPAPTGGGPTLPGPLTNIFTNSGITNPIFSGGAGQAFLDSLTTAFSNLIDAGCGSTSFNLDFSAYLENQIIIELSLADDLASLNIGSMVADACSSVTGAGGGFDPSSGQGPNATIEGVGGDRIASAARAKIGYSTKNVPNSDNGNLACAWSVSTIINDAGFSTPVTLGTAQLRSNLESDPCFTKVDEGYITSEEAMNLQPGDILVTPTNPSASNSDVGCTSSYADRCNSGHTGIYIGNGQIVSNGSKGFEGASAGISQNYTIDKWNGSTGGGEGRGVISRYPSQSAVYRRTCP